MSQSVEVCIIGAGISGLKAASDVLNKLKFTEDDILVLEAQDRIGGRLLTDTQLLKLGNSYDLGASWFHDCLSNVLFQHFLNGNDNDVFEFSKDGNFNDRDMPLFDRNGPVDMAACKRATIHEDIEKFIELYFFENTDVDQDISLKEIVDLYLAKYSKILTPQEIEIAKVSLRMYELWHGMTWERISARYLVLEHQGRDCFNLKGNESLIHWLLRLFPKERVQTNTPVTKIVRNLRSTQEHNKRIAVHTKSNGIVYCNYLVVTVPQSILLLEPSHEYGITWEPPLPQKMNLALQGLHFAALGKVIFEFESPWWDMKEDRFETLSDPSLEAENLAENINEDGSLKKLPKPFTYPGHIVNYTTMQKDRSQQKGGSLVLLTQTPLTEYLEEHPGEAWSYFKPALEQIAVKQIQEPINTITTQWTTNPYIRGSYSCCFPKDDPVDYFSVVEGEIPNVGLAESTIRFAGEHTANEGNGCIHGAWLSGEREANWIIKHSGKEAKF